MEPPPDIGPGLFLVLVAVAIAAGVAGVFWLRAVGF
jgi:hypothetical protein